MPCDIWNECSVPVDLHRAPTIPCRATCSPASNGRTPAVRPRPRLDRAASRVAVAVEADLGGTLVAPALPLLSNHAGQETMWANRTIECLRVKRDRGGAGARHDRLDARSNRQRPAGAGLQPEARRGAVHERDDAECRRTVLRTSPASRSIVRTPGRRVIPRQSASTRYDIQT